MVGHVLNAYGTEKKIIIAVQTEEETKSLICQIILYSSSILVSGCVALLVLDSSSREDVGTFLWWGGYMPFFHP